MNRNKEYKRMAKKVALDLLGLEETTNPKTGAFSLNAIKKIRDRYAEDPLYATILDDLNVNMSVVQRGH
ncbi:hypothetical protein [Ruegeria sp. HKCCA5763]|uniref:hypothetical protein n=1 Tax=Ruegeria sp. HKCCA5763 TaxID=2682987 RepID=UPI0014879150|nr:hypothetical protein [Ruegeria sp. HKCCA5763]